MAVESHPTPVPSIGRAPSSKVTLIPWDPESPSHRERMVQQRIACGWKQDAIESWRPLQLDGTMALQWVVLAEDDHDRAAKLQKHIAAFPSEATPIVDSATSLGGKQRTPDLENHFIPVGHISLDTIYEHNNLDLPSSTPGLYFIATFYISAALQASGLGGAAMDIVETLAVSEPLNARTLALATLAKDDKGAKARLEAMGRTAPKVSTQDWYARRGYEVFGELEESWWEVDKQGRRWPAKAVWMRKDIG